MRPTTRKGVKILDCKSECNVVVHPSSFQNFSKSWCVRIKSKFYRMEKDLVNNQGDGQKENEEYEFHSFNHWLSRPGEFLSLVDWWPLVYQLTFYLNDGVSFCSQKMAFSLPFLCWLAFSCPNLG